MREKKEYQEEFCESCREGCNALILKYPNKDWVHLSWHAFGDNRIPRSELTTICKNGGEGCGCRKPTFSPHSPEPKKHNKVD